MHQHPVTCTNVEYQITEVQEKDCLVCLNYKGAAFLPRQWQLGQSAVGGLIKYL